MYIVAGYIWLNYNKSPSRKNNVILGVLLLKLTIKMLAGRRVTGTWREDEHHGARLFR